jgi:hypothetical protein
VQAALANNIAVQAATGVTITAATYAAVLGLYQGVAIAAAAAPTKAAGAAVVAGVASGNTAEETAHTACLAGKTYTLKGWGTYTGSAAVWSAATDLSCSTHSAPQVAQGLLWVDAWAQTNGVPNPVYPPGASAWFTMWTSTHSSGLGGLFGQGATLQPNAGQAILTAAEDVGGIVIGAVNGNYGTVANGVANLSSNLGTQPDNGPAGGVGLKSRSRIPLYLGAGALAAGGGAALFFLL